MQFPAKLLQDAEAMISTTSEYALRALTRLAVLPSGEALLARDLAIDAGIPRNYLSKVLLALRNAGILDSTRGAGGGYRLRKPANEVFLMDVIEVFEGRKTKPICLLNSRDCNDKTPCSAHKSWRELNMAYSGFMLSTSIASLAGLETPRRTNGDAQTPEIAVTLASLIS
jgi:Rrf2 family protein